MSDNETKKTLGQVAFDAWLAIDRGPIPPGGRWEAIAAAVVDAHEDRRRGRPMRSCRGCEECTRRNGWDCPDCVAHYPTCPDHVTHDCPACGEKLIPRDLRTLRYADGTHEHLLASIAHNLRAGIDKMDDAPGSSQAHLDQALRLATEGLRPPPQRCEYSEGDGRSTSKFCGAEVVDGKRYCARHVPEKPCEICGATVPGRYYEAQATDATGMPVRTGRLVIELESHDGPCGEACAGAPMSLGKALSAGGVHGRRRDLAGSFGVNLPPCPCETKAALAETVKAGS